MQQDDEVREGIKKTVTFTTEETGSVNEGLTRPMTHFYQQQKQKASERKEQHKIDSLKSQILRCNGEYDELNVILKQLTVTEKEALFDKYGKMLLGNAIKSKDSKALQCFINNISYTIIHDTLLSGEGLNLLNMMIGIKKIAEEEGRFTHESRVVLAEKLNLIIGMGYADINQFIQADENYNFLVSRGFKLNI